MFEKTKHGTAAKFMLGLQAVAIAALAWWLYDNGQPVVAFFCAALSVVFAICVTLVRTWANMGQFGGAAALGNKSTMKH